MTLLLVIVILVSIASLVTLLKIVAQATGNLFDLLIYTFGNEEAAAEVKKRWESGHE